MIAARRGVVAALALVLALAWFAGLDHRKLIKPDEGRYGEIPREMVASGDWLTPRLNGFKYFEKPPLQYWTTAAAYRLFGVGEWQTRLWTALTAFGGIVLAGFAAARLYGATAGVLAAAVLAGSALYVVTGHLASLDAGVAFFLSLAVFAILLAQREEAGESSRLRWMLAAWSAAALAVLSKGLIGIVLPVAALATYLLWQRDWRTARRLHAGAGIALFLALSAPWFVAVSLANPEFFRFFFIHEHFERFLTKVHGRYEPPWYFVPVLAVGILPWLPALPGAVVAAFRTAEPGRFRPLRWLLAWCAVVFVFFSVSGSKLPSYILPMFPALAVLIGRHLQLASRRLLAVQAGVAILVGLAIVAFGSGLSDRASGRYSPGQIEAYLEWILAAGGVLAAASAAALWLAWRRRTLASVIALALAGLASTQLLLLGHESLAPAYSAYHLEQLARPAIGDGVPLYAVDLFDHTIPFYFERTVTMVGYRDELAAAISWEPQKFLPDVAAFAAAWRTQPKAAAIFRTGDFERIAAEYSLPAEIVARDARFVVVRKPGP